MTLTSPPVVLCDQSRESHAISVQFRPILLVRGAKWRRVTVRGQLQVRAHDDQSRTIRRRVCDASNVASNVKNVPEVMKIEYLS